MNQTSEQQTPASTPSEAVKQDYTKWIIIGVVGLVVLYGAQALFSPERAMEQATGGDVEMDGDGSMRVTSDDGGEYNVSAGNNVSLPDNWPSSVPLPSNIRLNYAGSMNGGDAEAAGLTAVYATKDSPADVVSYFKSTLESQGWKIEATMAAGEGSMITATKGENENVSVYISGTEEETTVSVNIQQPK